MVVLQPKLVTLKDISNEISFVNCKEIYVSESYTGH